MNLDPTKINKAIEEVNEVVEEKVDVTLQSLREFLKMESSGGLMLMAATVLALLLANSPWSEYYDTFLRQHLTLTYGGFGLDKPLLLWINDGLMAVFFLLVGLEIKREVLEGELSSVKQAILPAIAAIGGIATPALVYLYFNQGNEGGMDGWAIPAATDIAFALGILALFGVRAPIALKIFLTAVAVIDDLAAIVIIALFYTSKLSVTSLVLGGIFSLILLALNLKGSRHTSAYIFVGALMWFAVLKSGVHATLAGVILGFLIPHKINTQHGKSMLKELEHDLHPWVAFLVLPVFAFANAGIDFSGMRLDHLLVPIPLGVAAGLFIGKQVGIFGLSAIAIKLGIARLPDGINWRQFYAVSVLCGVGFTMSLFIGSLAFDSAAQEVQTRIGVMAGSLLSALLGSALLALWLPSAEERLAAKAAAARQQNS